MSENQPPPASALPEEGGGAEAFCPTCGSRLAPQAQFCTNCGAARGSAAPPPPPVMPVPSPPADATRVIPAARVVEREERFVDDRVDDRPAYAAVAPPPFNWGLAALIGLGLLILVLGLVLFVQAQDDTADTPTSTTTLPTTSSSSSSTTTSTTSATTTTTAATTTTTAATTTTRPPATTTTAPPTTTTTSPTVTTF